MTRDTHVQMLLSGATVTIEGRAKGSRRWVAVGTFPKSTIVALDRRVFKYRMVVEFNPRKVAKAAITAVR